MNEVNIHDTMLVAIITAIIPKLLKINWKKLDDLNFSFNECIIINGKYKYTTETKKTYQKLNIASASGSGTVINVFKAGRIIKGTILEIAKLKDNIDANCKFLFGL